MKIERILAGIRESQSSEKQASETAPAPSTKTASSQSALVSAMHDALNTADKTASVASASSPMDDVMKVAADLAHSEKEAAVKEAQILGAAFADSAIARLSEWNKTAADMLISAPAAQDNSGYGKFAQQNPDLLKQAAQLGYEQAKQELEKQAAESYTQGYNDTVEQIHKTASLEFLKAASVTAEIIHASYAR